MDDEIELMHRSQIFCQRTAEEIKVCFDFTPVFLACPPHVEKFGGPPKEIGECVTHARRSL